MNVKTQTKVYLVECSRIEEDMLLSLKQPDSGCPDSSSDLFKDLLFDIVVGKQSHFLRICIFDIGSALEPRREAEVNCR